MSAQPRVGHLAGRFADGKNVMLSRVELRAQRVVGQRARKRTLSARGLKAGLNDVVQILTDAVGRQDQWAFCGSDQADSFVTTSISRRSSATT
jgi:hypothetical protein